MNGPEKLKIEKLDKKDQSPGKELQDHDLVNYFDDNFFQDLKNGNCKIKKHNNLYIFEQKDVKSLKLDDNGDYIKKFCVKEKVLKEYLNQRQKSEEVALESDALLSEFLETINTKGELILLENKVIENTPEKINSKINNLLEWFENNKNRPRAPKLSESGYSRVRLKQVVRDNIASLKSIKRELKNYDYTTNIDYFEEYIDKLESHKEQLEKVRQIITTGGNTAEIPTILDSMQDTKKEELFQNISAEYNFEFNKIMKDITLNKLWNKDAEGFQKYLKGVRSGEIQHPSQDKFYEKHKKDFEEIMKKDPALYMDITTRREKYYNYEYASAGYNNYYNAHPEICRKKNGVFEKSGEFIADKLEDMGWIKNEKQKEAVKKLGKFAMVGTAIFLGFKFIQKLFAKKGTKNKRRDTALFGGGLFALFNIDKVTNFGKDLFNIDGKKQTVDTKTTAEEMSVEEENVEQYVKPQYTTVATLGGIPINTLIKGGFLTEKNGEFQIDYDSYKNYIESSDMDKDKEELILENLEIIKDDNDMLNNGLNSFGVNNLDDLEGIAGNDNEKTLLDSNKTNEYINNVTSGVNMKLNEEGFEPKNPKVWYKMTQEYDKENFNDNNIIERAKRGLIKLKNNKNYDLEEMIDNNQLDLYNKKIKGLDINFDTYEELFDAMNLTNFIKEVFKDKTAKTPSPFHIGKIWNIEFNNTKWFEVWKNETDVINDRPFKRTLKDLSGPLSENKQTYIDHLNDWWNKVGNVEK